MKRKQFPVAGGELSKAIISNLDADESEGGMADGGGHAADLAVFAFD